MKKTPAITKVTTSAPDKRNFIEINRSRRALPGGKVTPKAKAPVLSHTVEIAGNLPDSEVFSRPEFGNAALRRLHGFGAGSAHPQGRQHGYLHVTIPSPTLWPSQQKRGFQSQIGAKNSC